MVSTKASTSAKHQNVGPPAGAPTRWTATTTGAGGAAATVPVDAFNFGPGPAPCGGAAVTDSPERADATKGVLQILQRTFLPSRALATVDLVLHCGLGHWMVAITFLRPHYLVGQVSDLPHGWKSLLRLLT